MTACWVARSRINDPSTRSTQKFHRFVVIEFPSLEQAVACHDSPEYQEAAAFRKSGAGEVELVIVEGAS
jgi:uncharacterized protein (DUF1330 family)